MDAGYFLGGKGGKAVASFTGAYLCLAPIPLLATAIVFVVIVAWTRHISAGSIVGATVFPLAVWLISHPPLPVTVAAILSGVLILYRHRDNIERLRADSEHVFSIKGRAR